MKIVVIFQLVSLAAAITALNNPRLAPSKRRAITCGAFVFFAVMLATLTSFA
jgi:hypothetical protein